MRIEPEDRTAIPRHAERMAPVRLAYLWTLLVLGFDQASKLTVLHLIDLEIRQPIILTPVLDLILVWNRGISYGLFQQESATGQLVLLVLTLGAIVGLLVWMTRVEHHRLAFALGCLTGGAIGNAIDRAAYGAVVDFVHLHWQSWSWYVFNLADAAIVVGVFILMYDSWQADH